MLAYILRGLGGTVTFIGFMGVQGVIELDNSILPVLFVMALGIIIYLSGVLTDGLKWKNKRRLH